MILGVFIEIFFFLSNKLLDGQKATGGKPIQEPRTRMNRDTKVTKSEESTGLEEETFAAEGKEETNLEKDRDGKEERATLAKSATTSAGKEKRATLAKSATTSAPELMKRRQTTLAHSILPLSLPLVEHNPIEVHKPSPPLPPPPAMPSPQLPPPSASLCPQLSPSSKCLAKP